MSGKTDSTSTEYNIIIIIGLHKINDVHACVFYKMFHKYYNGEGCVW